MNHPPSVVLGFSFSFFDARLMVIFLAPALSVGDADFATLEAVLFRFSVVNDSGAPAAEDAGDRITPSFVNIKLFFRLSEGERVGVVFLASIDGKSDWPSMIVSPEVSNCGRVAGEAVGLDFPSSLAFEVCCLSGLIDWRSLMLIWLAALLELFLLFAVFDASFPSSSSSSSSLRLFSDREVDGGVAGGGAACLGGVAAGEGEATDGGDEASSTCICGFLSILSRIDISISSLNGIMRVGRSSSSSSSSSG